MPNVGGRSDWSKIDTVTSLGPLSHYGKYYITLVLYNSLIL